MEKCLLTYIKRNFCHLSMKNGVLKGNLMQNDGSGAKPAKSIK